MTGSPQTDPRIEAVAEFLLQQFGSKSGSTVPLAGHRLIARRFLATVDAADEEAAGIRRVTREDAEPLAVLKRALADFVASRKECDDEYCRWYLAEELQHAIRVAESAADSSGSPVGGVS